MALCGMKCVNLKNNTIKILGIHFSYNKSLENDENYRRYIIKIEKLLKLWRMRQLKIEGKILIFKTLAISKVVDLALVKLKQTALCNEYEQGGIKNADIFSKITSLQCSWVKRL